MTDSWDSPVRFGMTNYSYAALLIFAQDGNASPLPWWLPLVLVFVLLYFMILRPEQRKRSEMKKLLENLKKNDAVVTIGGIHGVIVNAPKGSEYVTIKIDESNNTKLRVLRSAVSRVAGDENGGEKKSEAKA